jgi:hypothetical protein
MCPASVIQRITKEQCVSATNCRRALQMLNKPLFAGACKLPYLCSETVGHVLKKQCVCMWLLMNAAVRHQVVAVVRQGCCVVF